MASPAPKAILFDVNETLLSMKAVKARVNAVLGTKTGFQIWFGLTLQYAGVDNSTGRYHDFTTLASTALDMAAVMLEKSPPSAEETLGVIKLMSAMPPHKEVRRALKDLHAHGFKLATLTQSTHATLLQQMQGAGLVDYFSRLLSIDAPKKYKPDAAAYQYAAMQLGLPPADILLVAAHGWDVAGAAAAGMRTAFIARPGQPLYPLAPPPDFVCEDIGELAAELLQKA